MDESTKSSAISYISLFLALLCPIFVVVLSLHLQLDIAQKIIVAVFRTIVQLLLAGYLLLGFIFDLRNPYIVLLYLLIMTFIATIEVTSRTSRYYKNQFRDAFLSVCAGGGLIGAFGSIVVFNPDPWWEPHVIIPTGGMIIGNSISGPSLAVEKILSDVSEKSYECETRLAFGATSYESILPTVRSALLQALTPNLNQMAVVGLVSIPGMMTGQLLGGAPPLTAALYQMAILWLICGTAALSTWTALFLATKGAIFDANHRLTTGRIFKKSTRVEGIDKILIQKLASIYAILKHLLQQTIGNNINTSENRTEYELVRNENNEDIETALRSKIINSTNSPLTVTVEQEIEESLPPIGTPERSVPFNYTYKVSYEFKTHNIFGNEQPFFEVNKLNVKSGDKLLFSDEGVTFSLSRGERICIEGPSGIGKTRLLRAIAKLDDLQSGSISFLGSLGSSIPKWRSRCMYIPQALPPMENTPKDLILEACSYRSRIKRKGSIELLANFAENCEKAASSVGLATEKMEQLWRDLSGGERQRALIAVALLLVKAATVTSVGEEPLHSILLMDEPTAACDRESAFLVEAAIIESKATVLMITHDDRQSKRFAHKSLILRPVVKSPFTTPSRGKNTN